MCVCVREALTLWVGLLVGVSCIDEAGGRIQFVLKLHVEPSGLTERVPSSYKHTHTHMHYTTMLTTDCVNGHTSGCIKTHIRTAKFCTAWAIIGTSGISRAQGGSCRQNLTDQSMFEDLIAVCGNMMFSTGC